MKLFPHIFFLILSALFLFACNSSPRPIGLIGSPPPVGNRMNYKSNNVRKGRRIKKIIVFVQNNYSDEKYISSKIKNLLINKGYTLPNRQSLPALQKEMSFCQSHLTRKCQLKLGNLTNADSILKIEKLSIDSDYVLTAELIDLATGNTRWAKTSGNEVRGGGNSDVFAKLLNTAVDDWLNKKGYSSKGNVHKESSKEKLDRKIYSLMSMFPASINSGVLR